LAAALGVLWLAPPAGAATACPAAVVSAGTFDGDVHGDFQTWQVPAGVNTVTIDASGAQSSMDNNGA
jgi:hypothetical protein